MSIFLAAVPWWGRMLAVGAVLVAATVFGAVKMREHDQVRYEALEARFEAFKDQTATLGIEAKAAAKAKEAADRKSKEDADRENADALATLARTIGELRNSRPSGSFVPGAPAGSPDPGRIAFDRAEFERATRGLVEGVRGLADEGSAATVKLDTARRWAQRP